MAQCARARICVSVSVCRCVSVRVCECTFLLVCLITCVHAFVSLHVHICVHVHTVNGSVCVCILDANLQPPAATIPYILINPYMSSLQMPLAQTSMTSFPCIPGLTDTGYETGREAIILTVLMKTGRRSAAD